MKKIMAILMALLMLVNCGAAMAEAAAVLETDGNELGYMAFTAQEYMDGYSNLADYLGLTWLDEPVTEFGYPMYCAANTDQSILVVVHDDGGVIGIEIDVYASNGLINDGQFGYVMGMVVSSAALTAYAMQHPDYTDEDMDQATAAIIKLVDNLNYIEVEGSEPYYYEALCDDMIMDLSWDVAGEEITIYFTVSMM